MMYSQEEVKKVLEREYARRGIDASLSMREKGELLAKMDKEREEKEVEEMYRDRESHPLARVDYFFG